MKIDGDLGSGKKLTEKDVGSLLGSDSTECEVSSLMDLDFTGESAKGSLSSTEVDSLLV